jgi:curved DNA-binding protein CbpA
MSSKDHYSTLGVLPDAEGIVITAAYRALAQRYHPDKWKGDQTEAHTRMSELNAAHHVLCDRVRRAAYDQSRKKSSRQEFAFADSTSQSDAFSYALKEEEERWTIACGIYPDLRDLRSGLAQVSTSLAFAFVTVLLDLKVFENRHELAKQLEQTFLARYFGNDP